MLESFIMRLPLTNNSDLSCTRSTTSANSSRDAETEKASCDDEDDAEDKDYAWLAGGPILFALKEEV